MAAPVTRSRREEEAARAAPADVGLAEFSTDPQAWIRQSTVASQLKLGRFAVTVHNVVTPTLGGNSTIPPSYPTTPFFEPSSNPYRRLVL